jgi:hypothetical protein
MQNYARIGGVLSIVSGAFGVLLLLFFVVIAVIIGVAINYSGGPLAPESPFSETDFRNIMVAIYLVIGVGYAAVGALGIVGGIFALKRKYWGWSLAGAIAGAITLFPCGIPAIIFVSLGRGEFVKQGRPPAVEEVTRQGGI